MAQEDKYRSAMFSYKESTTGNPYRTEPSFGDIQGGTVELSVLLVSSMTIGGA